MQNQHSLTKFPSLDPISVHLESSRFPTTAIQTLLKGVGVGHFSWNGVLGEKEGKRERERERERETYAVLLGVVDLGRWGHGSYA